MANTFESLVRLKQMYAQDVSGYILEVVSGYLTTGNFSGQSFTTGSLTGAFYPLNSNPAGYVNTGQTGQFATQANLNSTGSYILAYIGAVAYPNSNPNGYITATGLTGVLTTGMTIQNPIQWTDYFTTGTILSFVPNHSLEIAGPNSVIQFYNTAANPNGAHPYISGYDIWAYNINCTGLNNQPIVSSGYVNATFVPWTKFTKGQAGNGFSYFLLTDTALSTQTVFDAGYNFYLQGRNQTQISWPYIIDMYGSQAPAYSLTSGYPYILGFDLYSNNIYQSGYRVLTTNDIGATGFILSGQFLALSGYFQANENRLQTLLNNYMLSGISGAYPLVGNPSGFIGASDTGNFVPRDNTLFVTSGELLATGVQYPNGFFDVNLGQQWVLLGDFDGAVHNTFINVSDWDSTITLNASTAITAGGGSFTWNGHPIVTSNQTGNFVTTGQTGQFYPYANPLGFIPLSQVGGVRQIYVTGTPVSGNIGFVAIGGGSIFLSGNSIVWSGGAGGGGTATGAYVSLTGKQTVSGLKDFSSGIATSFISGDANYIGMVDTGGVISVDWNNRVSFDDSAITGVDWGNRYLVDGTSAISTDWGNRQLIDNTGINSVDWQNRLLVLNAGGYTSIDWQNQILMFDGQPGISWGAGIIFDSNVTAGGVRSIDYFNRLLQAPVGGESANYYTTLDWANQILTGKAWTINQANFVSGLTVSGIPVATGNVSVNTGSLTGLFYPLSGNPSGYVMSSQTGALTGQFYPYHTNPSGYITTGQTGIFVTTGQTGIFATNTGYLVMATPSVNIPSTQLINWNLSNSYYYTLSGSTSFTFTGASDGRCIVVSVFQPSGQNYTVTWPTGALSGVFWPYGIPPTQSSGAATDIYTFINFTGAIFGNVVQNFTSYYN